MDKDSIHNKLSKLKERLNLNQQEICKKTEEVKKVESDIKKFETGNNNDHLRSLKE